jgi:sugar lactone lactonase YvrE
VAVTGRSLFSILIAAQLCACSSAGAPPQLPATQASEAKAARSGKGEVTLRIRLPHARKERGARYISAATKGMTIAFAGPSTQTLVVNLTPSDPRCTGSPLVCTIAIDLAAGAYFATIDAYDLAPAGGAIPPAARLLSTAKNVGVSVATGKANPLGVTLDGVPASFVIGMFPSASAGAGFLSKAFSVGAKDADGDVIVGTYATPIKLTDGDESGATGLATSGSDDPPAEELLGSSDVAAISYTGLAIPYARIGAQAGSAGGFGIFGVHLPLYVADTFNNKVKEIPLQCSSSSCVQTLGGGFSYPSGVAVDQSGNVYVSDSSNNAVKKIPLGCFSETCVTTLGGGFSQPFGVAVDSSGNVFVADSGNGAVKKVAPACFDAGCVTTVANGFGLVDGVAVDDVGDVYVADTITSTVEEIPQNCFTSACYLTLGGEGFANPDGVAVGAFGDVYVADTGDNAVKDIPPGCQSASCVITIGGGFNAPAGVSVDGLGDVFVADTTNSDVKEIPSGCTVSGCVVTLGAGFNQPFNVSNL